MKPLVLLLIVSLSAAAADRDLGQWTEVASVPAGRHVLVTKKSGGSVRGEFVRATDDAVAVRAKQGEVSVARADVSRVELPREGHAKWWGLGIGAAAGAGIGGAAGERLANESAGDINIKAVAIAVSAAVGALIGLAIGAMLDTRHATVYRAS